MISKSIKETEGIAERFLEATSKNRSASFATVVGLHGDLGAGKTAFTKCVAKILGVKEEITSPTFVIEKIYPLSNQLFANLIHIDAYRLEKGEEILNLNWKEICADSKNLILIEWPENVADVMPKNYIKINFKFVDENTREIKMEL